MKKIYLLTILLIFSLSSLALAGEEEGTWRAAGYVCGTSPSNFRVVSIPEQGRIDFIIQFDGNGNFTIAGIDRNNCTFTNGVGTYAIDNSVIDNSILTIRVESIDTEGEDCRDDMRFDSVDPIIIDDDFFYIKLPSGVAGGNAVCDESIYFSLIKVETIA